MISIIWFLFCQLSMRCTFSIKNAFFHWSRLRVPLTNLCFMHLVGFAGAFISHSIDYTNSLPLWAQIRHKNVHCLWCNWRPDYTFVYTKYDGNFHNSYHIPKNNNQTFSNNNKYLQNIETTNWNWKKAWKMCTSLAQRIPDFYIKYIHLNHFAGSQFLNTRHFVTHDSSQHLIWTHCIQPWDQISRNSITVIHKLSGYNCESQCCDGSAFIQLSRLNDGSSLRLPVNDGSFRLDQMTWRQKPPALQTLWLCQSIEPVVCLCMTIKHHVFQLLWSVINGFKFNSNV